MPGHKVSCVGCGRDYEFPEDPQVDPAHPPSGAWFEPSANGWRITAVIESPQALTLFYGLLLFSLPTLGTFYGSQISRGQFHWAMSVLGIPFLTATLLFGWVNLVLAFGRVVVWREGVRGGVFVGVGRIGRTRRFDWRQVSDVTEVPFSNRSVGSTGFAIDIEADRPIVFGESLSEERRRYVLGSVRRPELRGSSVEEPAEFSP